MSGSGTTIPIRKAWSQIRTNKYLNCYYWISHFTKVLLAKGEAKLHLLPQQKTIVLCCSTKAVEDRPLEIRSISFFGLFSQQKNIYSWKMFLFTLDISKTFLETYLPANFHHGQTPGQQAHSSNIHSLFFLVLYILLVQVWICVFFYQLSSGYHSTKPVEKKTYFNS